MRGQKAKAQKAAWQEERTKRRPRKTYMDGIEDISGKWEDSDLIWKIAGDRSDWRWRQSRSKSDGTRRRWRIRICCLYVRIRKGTSSIFYKSIRRCSGEVKSYVTLASICSKAGPKWRKCKGSAIVHTNPWKFQKFMAIPSLCQWSKDIRKRDWNRNQTDRITFLRSIQGCSN